MTNEQYFNARKTLGTIVVQLASIERNDLVEIREHIRDAKNGNIDNEYAARREYVKNPRSLERFEELLDMLIEFSRQARSHVEGMEKDVAAEEDSDEDDSKTDA